ncbi:MAG: hypothetical protein GVY18_04505 [Bacteroidetes bacterium]|jgi:hypothetical protein|nr:hypothetical protein [Bacteroidota bacterium]
MTKELGTPAAETRRLDIYTDLGSPTDRAVLFKDSAGDPVDISSWSFYLDIRKEEWGEILLACTEANNRLTRGGAGEIKLTLSAADLDALGAGSYEYDLRVEGYGDEDWFPVGGRFVVQIRVSRRTS